MSDNNKIYLIWFITFLIALIPIIYFNVGYTVTSTNIYLFVFVVSLLFLAYCSHKKAAILESPLAIILTVLFAPGGILAITIMLIVNHFKGSEKMERTISNRDIQSINKKWESKEMRIKDQRIGNTVMDPGRDRRKGERRNYVHSYA